MPAKSKIKGEKSNLIGIYVYFNTAFLLLVTS